MKATSFRNLTAECVSPSALTSSHPMLVAFRSPGRRRARSTLLSLKTPLVLCTALVLLGNSTFAQTWQTVDDYQYVAGRTAVNYGLTVAPNGVLFAAGYAAGLSSYHALVMASTDNGASWSG